MNRNSYFTLLTSLVIFASTNLPEAIAEAGAMAGRPQSATVEQDQAVKTIANKAARITELDKTLRIAQAGTTTNYAQTGPIAVAPSATDSQISDFNQAHYCWAPAGTARNLLLLFLPGTGGVPRPNFPFTQATAGMGFHTIFLMYPDEVAAQQKCAMSDDPDSHMKFRLDVIRGGAVTARASSIENRFSKLLQYLSQHNSEQNWRQFLLADGTPDWSKVIVAGQSQGGGHAYVLGKLYSVNKVLMFGSPKDYSFYFHRPAKGFDENTKTPLNRFYAFNHAQDEKGAYDHELSILKAMGLTKYGVTTVDGAQAPFNNAHVLFTDAAISSGNYHGAPVSGRLPVCLPVWRYMLDAP